jgi:hypothetical protein
VTNKEANKLIKELKAHGKKISASPELAKEELQKAGINTKSGKLTQYYRGE